MRDQAVPRVVAKLLIPYILLYAFYVQWHGDYGPGGGFQAGVIFAAAIILYALIFDLRTAQQAIRPRVVGLLVPLGLLLYIGVGIACCFGLHVLADGGPQSIDTVKIPDLTGKGVVEGREFYALHLMEFDTHGARLAPFRFVGEVVGIFDGRR